MMERNDRLGAVAIAAALGLFVVAVSPAAALTDEEVFRTFRFNFVNPGGRALAMGGAFIGIADDATAAAANPAGMTNLISPELFTEWRLSDTSSQRLEAVISDPRGTSEMLVTDSEADADNILHPSFISFVYPFEHWVFGISRQEVLREDVDTTNRFRTMEDDLRIVQADGRIETLLEYYNATFAGSIGSHVALGLNLTYARMDVESRVDNKFNFGEGLENDYATVVDDSDDDFAWSAGILIKPNDIIHVGAVYREGPEFDLEESIRDTRPAGNFPSAGVLADFLGNRNYAFSTTAPFNIAPSTFDDPLIFDNHLTVPDQYGIGIGIRPTQSFTIAFDAVHVEFSDLEEDFVGNVNALTFPGDAPDCDFSKPNPDGTFPCDYTTPVARYEFDDGIFWRLGLEYVWAINDTTPFAIRGGVYTDPNTRLEADFGGGEVFVAGEETFPTGDDQTHYTAGFGFVLQEKFQADFAADFSNDNDTYIVSIIYHF